MADVEGPLEGRDVGMGVTGHLYYPHDPQAYLQFSFHPNAPFTGSALKWRSYVYDDGTTYEGLMKDEIPHGRGVMTVGKGELGAGGLADQKYGDRYEGEFMAGFAMGMGQYTAGDGTLYRGEFMFGKKDGCGVLSDLSPFYKRLSKGVDPQKAWKASQEEIEKGSVYGTWIKDSYVGGPDESGQLCHMEEIKGTLEEVEEVVARARMFKWKPDGDVGPWLMRDGGEVPAQMQQHPLHYPFNTGFLMPGPAGNAFAIPDDASLRREMATAAQNHLNIFRSKNLQKDPEPGSVQDKADKLWAKELKKIEDEKKRRAEIERRRIRQMEIAKGLEATGSKGGEGAAKTGSKGGEGAAKTGKGSGKAGGKSGGGSDAGGEGQRVAGKGAGAKGGASGAGSKGAGGKGQGAQPGARKPGSQDAPGGKRPQVVSDSDDEDSSGSDYDEDDLVASVPMESENDDTNSINNINGQSQHGAGVHGGRGSGFGGGSAFGSVTLGLSRAVRATHRAWERMAKRAQRMPKWGQAKH